LSPKLHSAPLLAAGLLAAACRASAPADPPEAAAPERDAVSALLTTSYRGRWGDGSHDHDVTEIASVTAGDPAVDALTFHALASASADLDGADSDDEFVFYSLSDTYDHRLTGHLYHAYLDVHRKEGFDVLRAGRQVLYETPETVYLDGLRVETAPRGERAWRAGAYGGVQALPYQSSRDGHYVLGAFAEARPGATTKLRADWLHAADDEAGDDADDLLALKGTWTPELRLSLEASHSRLVREARDARLAGRWFDPEADVAVEARYYELLTPQHDLAVPLDPFYATLFDSFPYREAGLSFGKGLGETWYLQAGGEVRSVADEDDIGAFNRDFSRWFATASAEDLLPQEVALSVTGEVWDGSDERFETWGLDLQRDFGEDWRADLGSYFSLYKFDFYLDEEREHVRTWYAGLRHQATEALSLRVRYELEHNDIDDFQTLRVGMTWEL
jgi:hypothetical protein